MSVELISISSFFLLHQETFLDFIVEILRKLCFSKIAKKSLFFIRGVSMIYVTKLNGGQILINEKNVQWVETL
ncbi:MAG: hypothetical protein K2X39_02610, partial [Silvanigrellaceae bacterium]|nr:hypothetical protein [Silvanigrellaceae bacterium]